MIEPAVAPLALITGATAGIGAEFARQLAAKGYDLVLVARDRTRLEATAAELGQRFGVSVKVLPADLLRRDELAAVERRVARPVHPVDLLVNNAGFGLRNPFEANDLADEQDQLDLLAAVPMRLTHAALQQMLPRHSGTILNVASVAGFTPRGTYGAAKAWLISFSRWANIAYRDRGVSVTALAPGFVRTEFHQRMQVRTDTIPDFLWLEAEHVVRIALRDSAKGKAVSVPTVRYKIIVWLSGWAPKRLIAGGALRGR